MLAWGEAGTADTLRVATYNTELERDGPGLLLRDILRGGDPQVAAVVKVIATIAPDVLLLQGIDYDAEARALNALRAELAKRGAQYPHYFAARPNAGMATGLDMDGDGRLGRPRDAQGYGRFAGQGGMAVLSKLPLPAAGRRDYTDLLWRDLPGASLPVVDGQPFPSAAAQRAQRLFSQSAWVVPVALPDGSTMQLLALHATTPVFDGPEDRNGLRNRDELRFWQLLHDGAFGDVIAPGAVLLGDTNIDPRDGAGLVEAMTALQAGPWLQDPRPRGGGHHHANPDHQGDPALDTADWSDPFPGNLRVDYVLPDASWRVADAAVFWPAPGDPMAETVATASRHHLVWVDLHLPR